MPNWKKVIVSGSNAHLNNITASGHFSALDDGFTVNNHGSSELFVDGNIIATGDVIGENYIVSSTIMHMTQSFSNGSTIFGDTFGDTHSFTGSIFITGGITFDDTPVSDAVIVIDTSSGRLYYTGSYGGSGGSGTGFPYAGSDDFTSDPPIAVITGSLTLSGSGHVTASGNVNVSGDVTTANINLNDGGIGNGLISHNNNTTTRFGFSSTNVHEIKFLSNAHQVLLLDKANGSRLGINSSPVEITGTEILLSGEVTASNIISASGNVLASNFTAPKGGTISVNTGQIRSLTDSDVLFIDGTDGSSIDFNDGESDVDVRIRGANGARYFKADADAEKVGIGGDFSTTVPGEELTVHGNVSASGKFIGSEISASTSLTGLTLIGNITASGNISGSGALFASLSFAEFDEAAVGLRTVVYAPESHGSAGKLFFTGSYGGGGGGATPGGGSGNIQYNDGAGGFAGESAFNYIEGTNTVVLSNAGGTKNIGLASPNDGPSLYTDAQDFFLAERSSPSTIFGRFDKLNKYLCLQPKVQNGLPTTTTTAHLPSARLHVIDDPNNQGGLIAKIINQNTAGKYNLLIGTRGNESTLFGVHKFISFHVGCNNDAGQELNGGVLYDPNSTFGFPQSQNTLIFQGVFIQSSDKKLKKHITFTKKSVDDIMSIKVKDFRWKEQPKNTPKNTGFIAQDLLETHPEMVRNIDGTLNVEYDKMIPLLVKAIQDQQHQINNLKEQLKNK